VVIMVAWIRHLLATSGLTVNWMDYIYLICRAENLKLQTKIRELEQGAENYALVSYIQL
jgi:hypothetical protein